jgi:sugar (pentulose or hexulose) kinase
MDRELLLGIDIGTQGVKGILVDPTGKIVAQHHIEHGSTYPNPDWCEQDMTTNWWENPVTVIRELLNADDVHAEQIKIVSASGLYPALGPTDSNGNPITKAILYSDNRSVEEVAEVNQALGLKLTSEELTPKLIWFLRHEPELAKQMGMFFDAAHYLVYKLSGEYVTDTITTGLYGAIYESPSASWRREVCEQFGIPLGILPKVHPPAEIIGTVSKEAAEITGLAEDTPVLPGMPDLVASLISVGAVQTHESAAYYGTAGLVPVMKEDLLNAVFHPYPIPERGLTPQDGYIFDYPTYSLTTGDIVRWFRDEFAPVELELQDLVDKKSAYAQLDDLAQNIPPGSEGLVMLPYLLGQRSPQFNPQASGVLFGIKKGHTRGHVFRAILESFGYNIRHGLESFYPLGHPIKRLIATGGGAASQLWRQIVTDITELKQEYVPDADGPIGCAYLGGLALGIFNDFDILQSDWVKVTAETIPNPENTEIYESGYQVYVELHSALQPVYDLYPSS